jgi:predicted phosphodiesterase
MRIFAVSDVHIDYPDNKRWIADLSKMDYRDDVLILAGDISDSMRLLEWCLIALAARFAHVLYVPGNHELWVFRDERPGTSLEKFQQILHVVENCGASMRVFHHNHLSIVPLLGWYDYSFGEPTRELLEAWMDYRACRWPDHFSARQIAEYFLQFNDAVLDVANDTIISFSHFLPRLDLMPSYIPAERRVLYPVLGTTNLEAQIRRLRPSIHVYGHSHVNRSLKLDDVLYVNNAFGYPQEILITAKQLKCIYETSNGA